MMKDEFTSSARIGPVGPGRPGNPRTPREFDARPAVVVHRGYLSGSPKSQDQKIFEHIVGRLRGRINPFERQAPEDEFTPRDRGVLIGHLVATRIAQGRLLIEHDPPKNARSRLRHLVRYTPPAVDSPLYEFVLDRCGVSERLAESEDPDAEQAFWGGFSTGVRAYIAQTNPNKRLSDGFHRRAQ